MPLIVSILKITVFQSIAISPPAGMPSMAIFAPCAIFASMSRNACGLPDISNPTSKPSFIPSSCCTSFNDCLLTSTASVTPSFRANSNRYGFTSVITV